MHKGIHFRILIEGQPILVTDSLHLHYRAKLEESTYTTVPGEWTNIVPLMELNGSGNEIVQIQMMAGEFADAPED